MVCYAKFSTIANTVTEMRFFMGDDTQQEKPPEQKLERLQEGMVAPRVIPPEIERGMVAPRIILPDESKGMVPPTLVQPVAQTTPPPASGQPVTAPGAVPPKVIPPKQSQPPRQGKPSKGK